MRQIATLPNEIDAIRFAAFLITQGVQAHAEEHKSAWAIWVRDEDHVGQARDEFERFQQNPNDALYQGAERAAQDIQSEEREKREQASKNVVEIRGKWSRGGVGAYQRIPFTKSLIFISIIATILGSANLMRSFNAIATTVHRQLGFCDPVSYAAQTQANKDPLVNIKQGQIWRLITPAFLHAEPIGGMGIFHVLFNMFWVYRFGGQIEVLRGAPRLAGFCLIIAMISNLLQATLPEEIGGYPFFGGMSGVVYGLFGYVWMKSWYDHGSGFLVDQMTVFILMGWLFLCMTPVVGNVANVAHVAGLVTGVLLGFLPTLARTMNGK